MPARTPAVYAAFGRLYGRCPHLIGLDGPKTRLNYCIKRLLLKLVARIISLLCDVMSVLCKQIVDILSTKRKTVIF